MFFGIPQSMLRRLGWVAITFGGVQFLRLLSNIILTRLLDPSVFGLMALVVAFRVGLELVTDVGVSQNIISNPHGAEPRFYDTAWTLQLARNVVLVFVCLALAAPMARFFNNPTLRQIIPVASIFFIFSGLESTSSSCWGGAWASSGAASGPKVALKVWPERMLLGE